MARRDARGFRVRITTIPGLTCTVRKLASPYYPESPRDYSGWAVEVEWRGVSAHTSLPSVIHLTEHYDTNRRPGVRTVRLWVRHACAHILVHELEEGICLNGKRWDPHVRKWPVLTEIP